jgi:hypothetical protein
MGFQPGSVEDAVALFSKEVDLPLGLDHIMQPAGGVTSARVVAGGERYGVLAYVAGSDGMMDSCSYKGEDPLRLAEGARRYTVAMHITRDDQFPGGYKRLDWNDAPFLGFTTRYRKGEKNTQGDRPWDSSSDPYISWFEAMLDEKPWADKLKQGGGWLEG